MVRKGDGDSFLFEEIDHSLVSQGSLFSFVSINSFILDLIVLDE